MYRYRKSYIQKTHMPSNSWDSQFVQELHESYVLKNADIRGQTKLESFFASSSYKEFWSRWSIQNKHFSSYMQYKPWLPTVTSILSKQKAGVFKSVVVLGCLIGS